MQYVRRAPSWVRYTVVVGYALCVLCASLIDPGDGVPRALFGIGVTVPLHVLAYAGLATTIGYATRSTDPRILLAAVVLATAYGAAIELLQGLIPYRTMATVDIVLNAFGGGLGAVWWWIIAPRVGVARGGLRSNGPR